MRDTEEFYRDEAEFSRWAQREGLEPGEQFILTRYLDPSKKTLEAGAAGGRILLALQANGFKELAGFDIVDEFIKAARERDKTGTIDYSVQDGRNLSYPDNSFDQLVYLQQFLSVVGSAADRAKALAEAFRVLRPGGRIVASVLCMRGRSKAYWPLFAWLWVLRTITFRSRSLQVQPWLRSGNAPNYKALLDRGPYIYWYYEQETIDFFRAGGFVVEAVGSDAQARNGAFFEPNKIPANAPFAGRFYLVATKPKPS
jgi:SAM-dependent methyltransferase